MDKKNEHIFENHKRLAKTLVDTFGRNCEVAIHDFEMLPNSLVHIEGTVTQRKPGAPITDLVIRAFKREGDGIADQVNYSTTTRDGRNLKSSTSFIRDEQGVVIGAFCINFDISPFMNASAAIDEFIQTVETDEGKETFASSLNETVESFFGFALAKMGKHPSSMTKDERVQFVEILEDQGAFLLKGAVEQVARAMGVSRFSVYNYLKEIRSNEDTYIK